MFTFLRAPGGWALHRADVRRLLAAVAVVAAVAGGARAQEQPPGADPPPHHEDWVRATPLLLPADPYGPDYGGSHGDAAHLSLRITSPDRVGYWDAADGDGLRPRQRDLEDIKLLGASPLKCWGRFATRGEALGTPILPIPCPPGLAAAWSMAQDASDGEELRAEFAVGLQEGVWPAASGAAGVAVSHINLHFCPLTSPFPCLPFSDLCSSDPAVTTSPELTGFTAATPPPEGMAAPGFEDTRWANWTQDVAVPGPGYWIALLHAQITQGDVDLAANGRRPPAKAEGQALVGLEVVTALMIEVAEADPGLAAWQIALIAVAGALCLAALLLLGALVWSRYFLFVRQAYAKPVAGDTATFLVTDIQGSTALTEADQAGTLRAVEAHNRLVRQLIRASPGAFEVSTAGDSFTVVFHTASAALDFALALQRQLLEVDWAALGLPVLPATEPEGEPGGLLFNGLRVRVGAHTGVLEPADFATAKAGPAEYNLGGVNTVAGTAALLCEAARPGGFIVMSLEAWQAAGGFAAEAAGPSGSWRAPGSPFLDSVRDFADPSSRLQRLDSMSLSRHHAETMKNPRGPLERQASMGVASAASGTSASEASGRGLMESLRNLVERGKAGKARGQAGRAHELGVYMESLGVLRFATVFDLEEARSASASPSGPTSPTKAKAVRRKVPFGRRPAPGGGGAGETLHRPKTAATGAAAAHTAAGKEARQYVVEREVECIMVLPEELRGRATRLLRLEGEQIVPPFSAAPLARALGEGDEVTIAFVYMQYWQVLNAECPEALAEAATALQRAVRGLAGDAGGYECESFSDGFLLAFPEPMKAATFATRLQAEVMRIDWPPDLLAHECASELAIHASGKGHAEEAGLQTDRFGNLVVMRGPRLRVGLVAGSPSQVGPHEHTGRAQYRGALMNRAARLASACPGGHVFTTRQTWEQIAEIFERDLDQDPASPGSASEYADLDLYGLSQGAQAFRGVRGKVEVVQLFNALLALRPFAARALTRQTSAASLRSVGSSAGGSPATFDEILDMRTSARTSLDGGKGKRARPSLDLYNLESPHGE